MRAHLVTKMPWQQVPEALLLQCEGIIHDLRIPLPQRGGAADIRHAQGQLLGRETQQLALCL